MTNRLAAETSPYLLQHKDNPVDWFAWGEEALAEAKRLDKPILLSVGYSACHWCHVMEHESFEDADTAALMNERYVNIKVDREERPDIDAIYMQAVQALTGRGGWPMTVFLTPESKPFYAGTYFPPEDRQGMPGFRRILGAVADAYRDRRPDVERAAADVQTRLVALTEVRPGDQPLAVAILDAAFEQLERDHDDDHGGFGAAPKFPQPMTLDFLLRYYQRTQQPAALEITERTLRAMAAGGMYDQVGGGFHRYSTDDVWLVPHFEKMLYDNALLARAYLGAYQTTGDAAYRRIVEETLDYVLREMTDPAGGFYSSQDADSEGEEGKFFLWTAAEIEAALGEDAGLIADFYGVSAGANFEGRSILHTPASAERFAADRGLALPALEATLTAAKRALYAAREQRVHPARDDKVITAWNGLMLRAFAEAGLALDSERYRDAAVRNADFLLAEMRPQGRLLRTWKRDSSGAAGGGVAKLQGYLEDYGGLIDGLIATYAASFEARFLKAAMTLAAEMLRLFWDGDANGFFDTGSDHEELITRPRDLYDNATPAGGSLAATALFRLAVLTDNVEYERRAVAGLRSVATVVDQAPTMFGNFLAALDFHLAPSKELAIVWPGALAEAAPLLAVVRDAYRPNLLLVGAHEGEGGDLTPLLRDRPAREGRPTAYVCERFVCGAPTSDPAELARQLDA